MSWKWWLLHNAGSGVKSHGSFCAAAAGGVMFEINVQLVMIIVFILMGVVTDSVVVLVVGLGVLVWW